MKILLCDTIVPRRRISVKYAISSLKPLYDIQLFVATDSSCQAIYSVIVLKGIIYTIRGDIKMSNPFEKKTTDIATLKDILSNDLVYRVPDYQRGYAWHDEFVVLWEDILKLYKTGVKKHYTGMLALDEIKKTNTLEREVVPGTTAFYVVDGQQRLTSLVIIIKSLITYIKEENNSWDSQSYDELLCYNHIYRFGYSKERNDDSEEYFKARIYDNDHSRACKNYYASNINYAKQYIDKELFRISDEEALKILNLILNAIVFNIYFVTTDFDVRVTFENINNRGKKLSVLERLKNRLMYLSTFFNDNHSLLLKNNINDAWKKIYESMGFGDGQLTDDEFLRAHWMVYFTLDKTTGDVYIRDLFNDKFSVEHGKIYSYINSNAYEEAFNFINKYINSLSFLSYYWALINIPDKVHTTLQSKEMAWIRRISRINSNIYLRSAMMVLASISDAVYENKYLLYSTIERYIFINKLIAQSNIDLSFLVTLAKPMISEDPHDNTELIDKFQEGLIGHEKYGLKGDRIKEALGMFINKYSNEETGGINFYNWNGLSYFLFEYNSSIDLNGEACQISWDNTSIEHILPQTPKTEYWKKAFRKYNDNEISNLTNSLGNLLLLSSGSENSSLSNFSYPVKRDMPVVANRFAYRDGSRSAREVAEERNWTANQIIFRTRKLIDFMFNRWFANVQDLSQTDIDEYKKMFLDKMPNRLNKNEYTSICKELDELDTSDERSNAERTRQPNKIKIYQNQLKEFLHPDLNYWIYDSSVRHREWFAFVIKLDNEDNLEQIKCGVTIDDIQYDFYYYYRTNKYEFWMKKDGNSERITRQDDLPTDFQVFLLSLKRYLRRAIKKQDEPIWITSNEE